MVASTPCDYSERGSAALDRLVRKVGELEETAERWRKQREAEEDIAKELATLNTMPSSGFHMGRLWGVGPRSTGCFDDLDESDSDDYKSSSADSGEDEAFYFGLDSSGSDVEEEYDRSLGLPWYQSRPRSKRTYFDLFGLDDDEEEEGLGRKASVDGVTSTVPAVAAPQVCSTVVGDEDDLVDLWYSTDYSLEAEGGPWYRDSTVLSKLRGNIENWSVWDKKVQLQRLRAIDEAGRVRHSMAARRREEEEEESVAEEKRLRVIEEKKRVEAEKRKVDDEKTVVEPSPQSPKKLAAPAPVLPNTPDFARHEITEKPVAVPIHPVAEEKAAETLQTAGLRALENFVESWSRKTELAKKYRAPWKEICISAQQVSSSRKSVISTADKVARALLRNRDTEETVRFLACASAEKLISCSVNNSLDFVWTTAYHVRLVAEKLKDDDVVKEWYLHALVGCLNFKCPWVSWIDTEKARKAGVKHVDSSDWYKEQEKYDAVFDMGTYLVGMNLIRIVKTFVNLWLALCLVLQDITCVWQWIAALVNDAQGRDPALPMLVNCYLRVCRYDLKRWLGQTNQSSKLDRLFSGPIRDRIREIRSLYRASAVVEHYGLLCETALDDSNIRPPDGMEITAAEESELNSNV
ncbi:hypothetical protein Pmar_PMAR000558 [Perkinsus marinus ATCC 50983]|uniref:Uncharacterized protein n=1 Tax=Perkinsus marinus (strain ATCC 50983 / TXsc) TaxID=423536 RepID=C5LIY6_PERM5|nr:hypothetical protein Pmar_PMAR000558 [Perkinsus marinus ATCC 50983]EER03321.1 hypothetical protein Pmar_PMAR000558 [Perkinsus marinus ATCC 50983]|eukprot:XP_002771505.1 hypothetical protein Pmar_PMAR000558 [Perkinsus marinus ATCC 50983]